MNEGRHIFGSYELNTYLFMCLNFLHFICLHVAGNDVIVISGSSADSSDSSDTDDSSDSDESSESSVDNGPEVEENFVFNVVLKRSHVDQRGHGVVRNCSVH